MLDGFCPQKKYGIAFLPTCGARLKHKWSTGVAQFIIRAQFVDKNCTKRAQNRKKETEMNAMKKKIAVKVVSDTICPWCYIGKKRLESAIQSFTASSSASVEFEVRHVPYLLLPQLPKEGLDKRAFYRKRVGEERYGVMVRSLQELGLSFSLPPRSSSAFASILFPFCCFWSLFSFSHKAHLSLSLSLTLLLSLLPPLSSSPFYLYDLSSLRCCSIRPLLTLRFSNPYSSLLVFPLPLFSFCSFSFVHLLRCSILLVCKHQTGKSLNIKFKEDGTIGNTVLSHRLLEYAHRKGKQQEVLLIFSLFLIHCLSLLLSSLSTRLFTGSPLLSASSSPLAYFHPNKQTLEQVYKIYFEEGQNLASKDVLLAAAERAGLERTPTEQFLDGEEDLDFVLMLDRELKDNRGVHGVPHFIFNDKYAFGGAQEEAVFTSVFQKVLKDQRQTATQSKPSTEEAFKTSKL
ncbi:DsbA family oxidoreductase, variant 2 [Balamuthia mandrillaris]